MTGQFEAIRTRGKNFLCTSVTVTKDTPMVWHTRQVMYITWPSCNHMKELRLGQGFFGIWKKIPVQTILKHFPRPFSYTSSCFFSLHSNLRVIDFVPDYRLLVSAAGDCISWLHFISSDDSPIRFVLLGSILKSVFLFGHVRVFLAIITTINNFIIFGSCLNKKLSYKIQDHQKGNKLILVLQIYLSFLSWSPC